MFKKAQQETVSVVEQGESLQQLTSRRDGLRAELGQLRQIVATGEAVSTVMQPGERVVFDRAGRAATVATEEPAQRVRQVGLVERLTAKRRLGQLEDELLLVEAQVEEARIAQAERDRVAQEAARRRGEQVMRQRLPGLIAKVQSLAREMADFQREAEALDGALARRYFAEAVYIPLLPGQSAEYWAAYVTDLFLGEGQR